MAEVGNVLFAHTNTCANVIPFLFHSGNFWVRAHECEQVVESITHESRSKLLGGFAESYGFRLNVEGVTVQVTPQSPCLWNGSVAIVYWRWYCSFGYN